MNFHFSELKDELKGVTPQVSRILNKIYKENLPIFLNT